MNPLSPQAQKVWDEAKAKKSAFEAVDASHLTPEERRTLAAKGLSFTVDRERRPIAHYPDRLRQEDLKNAVLAKRNPAKEITTFNQAYKKIIEDVTASSAFGSAATGDTGGQFPATGDKGYAPGDARMPKFLGSKRVKGKRRKPLIMRRNLVESTKKKHDNPRLGKCYELSGRYVIDGMFIPDRERATLVHGRLVNPFGVGHPLLDHAWIETDDEIYDPVMDKTWGRAIFYSLFKPTVFKRYNREEARKMILKHKHWGPWE